MAFVAFLQILLEVKEHQHGQLSQTSISYLEEKQDYFYNIIKKKTTTKEN